ncbi:hypothetical protein ACOSP6_13890 [Tenacibaculum sp. MEBiC06402]|uniref:hypothetical protein n=1 Tax=unclassified Tenacibaculum TaxID=2635139 RepID=UPI003B9D1689
MNFTQKLEKGQDVINGIIERAWQDDSFKSKLMSTPKEAIEEFTGKTFNLKDNKSIEVEDQTDPNVVYLNIPKRVEIEDLELSENELEAVSGGDFGASVLAGIVAYVIVEVAEGVYEGLTN